ncbi:hypothetical protein [Xenorhabdus bovienii]|uniref:hypothetical protein n=1 Tax=Xenorhabdus bovienii TaxID=40576 RepID=UPI00237C6EFD|nr:hypothetical protein [Xenorhabdus bovienii]MDE1475914.1 hypothetical protein [Xenorhabdus bovienii]
MANYYKSHNNQQKLAVIVYHNATLRALIRHFRGFFHWTPDMTTFWTVVVWKTIQQHHCQSAQAILWIF